LRFDSIAAQPNAVDVEFKNFTHPDNGVRAISAFEFCEFQRCRAIGEQAATRPSPFLRDPVSFAVAADQESRRQQT
jgi:hypothetical protein